MKCNTTVCSRPFILDGKLKSFQATSTNFSGHKLRQGIDVFPCLLFKRRKTIVGAQILRIQTDGPTNDRSLINPPPHIVFAFGPTLQASLPNEVEIANEKDMLIVEIKRQMSGTGGKSMASEPPCRADANVYAVKPSHFLMQVLKVMVGMGFNLDATVAMARGGPLGMGARRELFVFKGVVPMGQ
jgi:hypothetical protein